MREDAESNSSSGSKPSTVVERHVYRHVAVAEGLTSRRVPYRVVSFDERWRVAITPVHTLSAVARAGEPVTLLLTSDHQLKTMTPANLELVGQTVGTELDGVLMAGDLVNVPDRASEWFDDASGLAFFAGMTGRAHREIAGRIYRGAPLLQNSPLYPVIGNHEVMGRYSTTNPLSAQFNDPQPRRIAMRDRTARGSVDDRSWNVRTYEELFPYPRSNSGGSRWWSRTVGDVFLVGLFVTQIWRVPTAGARGRYSEAESDLRSPERWGYGQFPFESVAKGSEQYRWAQRELSSPEARRAKYRVVMFHHPSHGLGDNSAPPFSDPEQSVERDPATGEVSAVRYHYSLQRDEILTDLEPMLNSHGVHLVLNGHSHIWNRFRNARGMHWLETSNVGNTYGAYDTSSGASRAVPQSPDYVQQGDPGGLRPVVPTIAPLTGPDGTPLPFVSSNSVTAFSVLDSGRGVVRSYRYDTRTPKDAAVLFDEFSLL
ncbi:metallophosphoesterase [Lentzea sp. HUAS12]|uniref:metallophosphoesterase family protein n=1 Tax=Lentzea sp. HUAS12 TaxID=2951806 RepID=UPI0020A1462E|nr:metallophosphoesterase [Lentzea sp. HUAS12]USX56360.1 metallophosphoesterase [Lentzea sp. HUAS12]